MDTNTTENVVNTATQAASAVTDAATSPEAAAAANALVEKAADPSFIEMMATFMDEGGIFMWIILAVWSFGIAIAVERIKSLFSYDVDGGNLMNKVKKHVLLNEVQNAISLCSDSKGLLPQVLRSGLKRANQTKEQITDAMESSILEVVPKVDKRMSYLGLIANVSTLIGLLGTIYGLIESFAAVASADPASKAKLLALGISKAMNTTAFGLISAISIMVIHTLLTNKSEKIVQDIEQFASKLVDLLGTKTQGAKSSMPATPQLKAVSNKTEDDQAA